MSTSHGFRLEYDAFDYGNESRKMTLDEAVSEAARLTASDQDHFYRVVPVDSGMSGFRVEKVKKDDAFKRLRVNFLSRLAKVGS